jgi:hypothetical protein
MGKSSPPPAPTPPTPQEISAANIESAKGLTRLQRAMQFGEPLYREGVIVEDIEGGGQNYYTLNDEGVRQEITRDQAIEADFTGMGDTDISRQQWEFEKETSPERTQFLLEQMERFGPEFTEQARALVERSDPTGFAARELLGRLAQEYEPAEVPIAEEMEFTEEVPVFGEAEITGEGRGALERQLVDALQSGRTSELMGEEARRIARGRQAATGNIFGGGAVLDEARAVRQAEDAGQRQAASDLLGLLTSGQSATDTQNRIDETNFARQQAAMGQRNQARQQAFSNAMQRTATQQQMQQQQMANLQSFSGLAPVSGQFGGLAGAQAAAGANFNPIQYQPTSAAGLLAGQQSHAGNVFGTQANIWGKQAQMANQPSGFGSILGTVAGGLAGNAGFGAMLGNRMFGGGSGASPTQIWNNLPQI